MSSCSFIATNFEMPEIESKAKLYYGQRSY